MAIKKIVIDLLANNESLSMGSNSDFNITNYKGFESSDYQISYKLSAQVDTSTITARKVLPREITIEAECTDSLKDRIMSFFNPKNTGKMTVELNGNKRWIGYEVKSFKIKQDTLYHPIAFIVTFLCPQPFFLDMDDFGKDIASTQELFAFPFVWQIGRGFVTDYRRFSTNFLVVNGGDVDTGMKFEFYAKDTVVNPQMRTDDGSYIRVLTTMQKGDLLEINTNTGQKAIYLNGTNITNRLDRTSNFIGLKVGKNVLIYTADSGYLHLSVRLFYRPMYLGV